MEKQSLIKFFAALTIVVLFSSGASAFISLAGHVTKEPVRYSGKLLVGDSFVVQKGTYTKQVTYAGYNDIDQMAVFVTESGGVEAPVTTSGGKSTGTLMLGGNEFKFTLALSDESIKVQNAQKTKNKFSGYKAVGGAFALPTTQGKVKLVYVASDTDDQEVRFRVKSEVFAYSMDHHEGDLATFRIVLQGKDYPGQLNTETNHVRVHSS